MANEQELLIELCGNCGGCQPKPTNLASICSNPIEKYLYRMGCVKWDREKVAKLSYEGGAPKPYFDWDTAREKDKNYYLKQADQLKEILGDRDEKV